MGEQLIIAVSREFGSGGHAVAQILSEKYNIHHNTNPLLLISGS